MGTISAPALALDAYPVRLFAEGGAIMATGKEIRSLHRYFVWADRMRVHFAPCVQRNPTVDEIAYG